MKFSICLRLSGTDRYQKDYDFTETREVEAETAEKAVGEVMRLAHEWVEWDGYFGPPQIDLITVVLVGT